MFLHIRTQHCTGVYHTGLLKTLIQEISSLTIAKRTYAGLLVSLLCLFIVFVCNHELNRNAYIYNIVIYTHNPFGLPPVMWLVNRSRSSEPSWILVYARKSIGRARKTTVASQP